MAGASRDPARTPRTVLEQQLWALDRTYAEVVADFEHTASESGEKATITERHLRRLASGERAGATPVTRRVLHAMFGLPADELLRPPRPATADGASVPPLPVPDTLQETLDMAESRARQFVMPAGTTNVTPEAVDRLTEATHEIARAYQQVSVSEVLQDLTTVQESAFTLLEGRQPPLHSAALYYVAGLSGGLLAKCAHDLGDPRRALSLARTALLCAENASHQGLQAWVRGLQSLVAYWADRPRDALRLSAAGAEPAARAGGTAQIWLTLNEARAWGRLGNTAEAKDAIRRADDMRAAVEPNALDEIGGTCTFSESRQLYYAADALAWLPEEAATARRYAEQAVAAYRDENAPDWAFGDMAGSRSNLALALVGLGEQEGASQAMGDVLALPPAKRIHGIVASVERVHASLRRVDLGTEGEALLEEIETFTRNDVRALPA